MSEEKATSEAKKPESSTCSNSNSRWLCYVNLLLIVVVIAGFGYGFITLPKIGDNSSFTVMVKEQSQTIEALQSDIANIKREKEATDTQLVEVNKKLEALLKLQEVDQASLTEIYNKLMALGHQVDNLPLLDRPMGEPKVQPVPEVTPDTPWWKAGLLHTWSALKHMVVIRYEGTDALPLVLPKEKVFLNQNMHAQLDTAVWGLLHHNQDVYHAALLKAREWVDTYYAKDSPLTQQWVKEVNALLTLNVQKPGASSAAAKE